MSFEKVKRYSMINCFLRYEIDTDKLAEFETYARMWISLVEKLGGTHHGYLLPHEGASDTAYALFSFSSLAEYELYRTKAVTDEECRAALEYYQQTKCLRRFERTFMKPLLK